MNKLMISLAGKARGRLSLGLHGSADEPLPPDITVTITTTKEAPVRFTATVTPSNNVAEFPDAPFPMTFDVHVTGAEGGIELATDVTMVKNNTRHDLALVVRSVVDGDAIDEHGRTISGARIIVVAEKTRDRDETTATTASDASGLFHVALSRPHGRIRIAVAAPGFAPQEAAVDQVNAYRSFAHVILKPGGRIRGRVLRTDGRDMANCPVRVVVQCATATKDELADTWLIQHLAGAMISRSAIGSSQSERSVIGDVLTDDHGRFDWCPTTPVESVSLIVRTPGGVPLVPPARIPASATTFDLDFGDLSVSVNSNPVRIRFVDRAGQPKAGLRVVYQAAFVPTALQLNSEPAFTDADGWLPSSFLELGREYYTSLGGARAELRKFVAQEGMTLAVMP